MSSYTYPRVIPRDFFNESKLLKCMGQLALLWHDRMLPEGVDLEIEESGEPFEIVQLVDGELTVQNYPCTLNGQEVCFSTAYNSRRPYPLYCTYKDEQVLVFDDQGLIDRDFVEFARQLGPATTPRPLTPRMTESVAEELQLDYGRIAERFRASTQP